jgi:hypothetical protein
MVAPSPHRLMVMLRSREETTLLVAIASPRSRMENVRLRGDESLMVRVPWCESLQGAQQQRLLGAAGLGSLMMQWPGRDTLD